jgi:2-polyprenyl-6-methoxyphenol hydroxylase-like FAD-dependent oxidoreductase
VNGYYDKEPAKQVRDRQLWLIGDAAHPMCPLQGEGANTAMVDALKLAKYFGDSLAAPNQAETNARALEADIIARDSKAVQTSRAAAQRFHETAPMRPWLRNISFRIGNTCIQMGTRGGAAS